MTQEPWEGLDGSQAAVLALCHPREGEERGRFAGSPARKELGGRGRVEKSFSCESRDDSCHHGGERRWRTGSKPSRNSGSRVKTRSQKHEALKNTVIHTTSKQ